jgi:transcriptional regulator with XRE-family HTH domain
MVESENIQKMMRYSAQIRAARALLGWSQDQLAREAEIGPATLRRIEQNEGVLRGNFSTILKIQRALEQHGIHFTEDSAGEIGVRMKKKADDTLGGEPAVRLRKAHQRGKRK